MSEQLRHKMINLEVAPPSAAWEVIAARLNDDGQYNVLSAKINNFEVTPPPITWDNISTRINDDIQYAEVAIRMNDCDAAPPTSVWQSISTRLDDDEQYTVVSEKLKDFDAAPPSQIWGNVLNALNETEKNESPVINIRRVIYRIAAAAIVIGFFVGGLVMIRKNTKTEIAKNNNSNTAPAKPATNNKENNPANYPGIKQKTENIVAQNKQTNKHRQKNDHSSLAADAGKDAPKYAEVNDLTAHHKMPDSKIVSTPLLDKNGNEIADIDVLTTNSNYIVVAGPNGQLTRISSKFANVIRFLNDDGKSGDTEEYLDKVIKESSTWKKRFQEWRNKISQSSYIPSSVNFLDIVEFKDLIQEKK